ncbi:MAG: NADP-dependent glyceraldehyde-3-phosphate dehydrogenase [Bacteroidales bacterium]|nr:NADP-dependent glyceraldehyde-3-phosphate dehydrogenase [Bacteroidales bacterium]HOY39213.1 NADP-dependent glyceraldehyde-3-phosphate dehydrogenase [Bacteroidales bacterium]HQN93677.1 NADP-dependent glyceraldehyde-3-phosphate dehydrogenase [Prolixibacteraceae bacterium]
MIQNKIFPLLKEIPEEHCIPIPFNQTEYLLNGELMHWEGPTEKVFSPVYFYENNTLINLIGSYPLMDGKTAMMSLHAAIEAYNNGQGTWPKMTISQRIGCMRKFILLMKEQRDIIVKLLMWEIGKNLTDSQKEFDRTVEYINDTIEALKDMDREASRLKITQGVIAQIKRSPLGVVLCMGPFNYPLNETFATLIPALIMGNTVIFKPPKLGVLLHAPLLRAFQEAFPKGVVNTVYGEGREVIAPIMESGKVNVLAFIGSCKVADTLKKQHPHPHLLKSVLGLEAKNPAIILKVANIENAVKECVTGALSFNGQRCTALKILFVHDSIYDDFINRFISEVDSLKSGMPWEKDVNITPLPEDYKPKWLEDLIEDAVNNGAVICNKNGGIMEKSLFFPVVLSGVSSKMQIYHLEQFGPVIPVVKFHDVEEPLEYVVTSNFGQQASIFGEDPVIISVLVDTLVNQLCRVNINSQCQRGPDVFPFTGRKDSAEGTLSVSDALRVFSIRSLVALKENDTNKKILTDILNSKNSNFLSTDYIL